MKNIFFYITYQRDSEDPHSPTSLRASLDLQHGRVSRAPHYANPIPSFTASSSSSRPGVTATAPASPAGWGQHHRGAGPGPDTSLAALPSLAHAMRQFTPLRQGASLSRVCTSGLTFRRGHRPDTEQCLTSHLGYLAPCVPGPVPVGAGLGTGKMPPPRLY